MEHRPAFAAFVEFICRHDLWTANLDGYAVGLTDKMVFLLRSHGGLLAVTKGWPCPWTSCDVDTRK
eukprot:11218412-Karenia_brevis.AAC.1